MWLSAMAALGLAAVAVTGRQTGTDRAPVRLLFSDRDDARATYGRLHFGVTPVRLLRRVEAPGFSVVTGFPLSNGNWEVFGQTFTEIAKGDRPWEQTSSWRLVRAITTDGIAFRDVQTVLEPETGPWTPHIAVARHGVSGEYIALKLRIDRTGFAYTAFFSSDGKTWKAHPGNPLFYDGDSMSLFWSPPLQRYVCINKSLQPYRKHIRDHGGTTRSLNDDALRDRRVLMVRTSSDGRHWEPSVSLPDVWEQEGRKGSIPEGWLLMPDADDPPDLEFYSGNAFWYRDRAYMMVLNYAASPLSVGKHGPQLDNEWWTSRDGLRWERPARGSNALDVFPGIPRLESAPLLLQGQILFPRNDMLLGLPEDRITYVSSRSNAEFVTRSFVMPDADLTLNAAIPSPDRPFAGEQAYIMVAVEDADGRAIEGYDAGRCVVQNEDRSDIALRWNDASARSLAGRKVRLRFHLRSADVYAVSTGGR